MNTIFISILHQQQFNRYYIPFDCVTCCSSVAQLLTLQKHNHTRFCANSACLDLLSGFVEIAAHERDFDNLISDPHKKLTAALQDE